MLRHKNSMQITPAASLASRMCTRIYKGHRLWPGATTDWSLTSACLQGLNHESCMNKHLRKPLTVLNMRPGPLVVTPSWVSCQIQDYPMSQEYSKIAPRSVQDVAKMVSMPAPYAELASGLLQDELFGCFSVVDATNLNLDCVFS